MTTTMNQTLQNISEAVDGMVGTLSKVFESIEKISISFRNLSNAYPVSCDEWEILQQSILLLDHILWEHERISSFFQEEADVFYFLQEMNFDSKNRDDYILLMDDILEMVLKWKECFVRLGKSYALLSSIFMYDYNRVALQTLRLFFLTVSETFKKLAESMTEMAQSFVDLSNTVEKQQQENYVFSPIDEI